LGYFDRAYILCKAGFLFTGCESLALKYLKLAEKCDKKIEEVRGIVGFMKGKA
jgi:hypothetical protein